MQDDLTNIENPMNQRDDLEERNQPHVTQIPAEAGADDLFDDTRAKNARENPDDPLHNRRLTDTRPRNPCDPPAPETPPFD